MEMPKVLDTDDFIAFAGGTGRDIWAVATAARVCVATCQIGAMTILAPLGAVLVVLLGPMLGPC